MKNVKVLKMYVEDKKVRTTYNKEEEKQEQYIEYIFIAKVRVGLKVYWYRFITMDKSKVCAYLQDNHLNEIPNDKEIREQILIKVYGELMRVLAEWKMEETLVRITKELEEEKRQKEKELKEKEEKLLTKED